MLYFYSGTDREKARAAVNAAVEKLSKKISQVVRVTDANTLADLSAALQGGGMFGGARVVVLDSVLANEEMRVEALESLQRMQEASDTFFMLEGKADASTRKQIEKYAERSEKFESGKKQAAANTIFALANALRRSDKKSLWVSYQRELANSAPEAIHGVLFWGAKDMLLKAHSDIERARAKKLIATLAELPHEARRSGVELEYALERFVLSGA